MRISTLVIVSCLIGVAVGYAMATSALTINAWNPRLEYEKQSEIIRAAGKLATDPNARASIDDTVHDFGIMDVKDKGKQDFVIRNVGTAPLTLRVDRTSCTCTGIDLSKKRVLPGDSAVATVHYDAERAMTGPYQQGGVIETNDPENREIQLTIKGIFTSPIVLDPSAALFPTVPAAEARTAKIRIYGFEKTPLRLETPEWGDRSHFDMKLTPSELSKEESEHSMYQHAGSVYDAEITVKPGLPVGTFQEKFYVRTNYPSEPSFEFMARGQIAGSGVSVTGMGFNKDTGLLVIGQIARGQRLSRDVSIQFSGSTAARVDLKIGDVKPEWIQATLAEPRDLGNEASRRRFYTLTVVVPASAPVCNFMKGTEEGVAMITLETGLPDAAAVKIPIQLAVVER